MTRYRTWTGGLILGLGLMLAATPARAVITRLTPLRDVLAESRFIFMATVETVDAERPSLVLAVDADLKGKAPFRKLPVLLKGDAGAVKKKETALLLERVAPKLPIVVFVSSSEDTFVAFGYSNGTWFQMTGSGAGAKTRWSFTHLEPYLRKTFKGPTAALRQVVVDGLAGKKKPPAPDAKEKPGYGPKVSEKRGRSEAPLPAGVAIGVIPSVLIGGPLAMLAMLFPTVFGGWRRWLSLLSVAGTNSTLYFVHWWFGESFADSWWGSDLALWTGMTLATLAGAVWAWQRHVSRVRTGQAPAVPGGIEFLVLAAFSVVGVVVLALGWWFKQALLGLAWLPVLVFCVGVWVGTLYATLVRRRTRPGGQAALATEVVVLTTMVFACTVLGAVAAPRGGRTSGGVEVGEARTVTGAHKVRPGKLVWTFRPPGKGAIASSPRIEGERVYVGVAHDSAFSPYGALYCVDRATGKQVWGFHNGKKMKPVFSSPCIADGNVYIGEGFHQDSHCNIYCLKADTGAKVWEFPTRSHTEATPCVADGKVYCGAGDDGLYCLDAATGKEVWNFPGFHIDASPVVAGGRVYAGSGVGDAYQETFFFCLDAATGAPVWRVKTKLPVWAEPVVAGGRIYLPLGNGHFNESDAKPAGALLCLDATTGQTVWDVKVPDGVLDRPLLAPGRVGFGSRDGRFYWLDRADGKLAWKRDLGSPVVAGAALARCACCGTPTSLYAVGSGGQVCCLAPDTGRGYWTADVADLSRTTPELYSSPALEVRGQTRRLYVGASLISTARLPVLYCFEDEVAPAEKEDASAL